jgi:monofunctional biosynthetic peptidoglycan transglycosylase
MRSSRRRGWRWALAGAGGLAGVALLGALIMWWTLPDVKALRTKNPTSTAFIDLRRRQAEQQGKAFKLQWTWRPLSRISPFLQRAVLHTEDAKFFKHEGVDWEAVRQTAEKNWQDKSLSRGGSTITQQVAKNLYLSPERSLIRKVRELFIAWRLEDALGKERILEIYLNIAEWGDGVFGAEAAARRWYGRSAAELSPDQAARLAVALPNPFTRSPRTRSRALDRKAARIVRALHRGGLVSEAQLGNALRTLGQAPTVVAPPPAAHERDDEPAAPVAGEGAPAAEVPSAPPPRPQGGDSEAAPPEGAPTGAAPEAEVPEERPAP